MVDSPDTPQSESAQNSSQRTRRTLLTQAATLTGLSVGSLATLTDTSAAQQQASVTELTGGDRATVLSRALVDDRTKKLRQTLIKADHHPETAEASTVKATIDGNAHYTVVIPFSSTETRTYIAWSDNPNYDPQVAAFEIGHREPATEPAYWDITIHHIVAGEVITEHEELENFLGCDTVNWSCVLTLAGAYSGTIVACGACVASEGWLIAACAECIAAILGSSGATLSCDWCHD